MVLRAKVRGRVGRRPIKYKSPLITSGLFHFRSYHGTSGRVSQILRQTGLRSMTMRVAAAGAMLLLSTGAVAQTVPARRGIIRASGEASVSVRPDVARVALGVLTQDRTATDAATKNTEQAAAVIAALRSLLGAAAEIRTISYTLGPMYNYPPGGQPQLTGFSANNVVEAVVSDLALIGRVIDAAIQAGANRVDSLRMGLKEDDAVRAQALRLAGQKARAKAEAIAAGLGVRLGPVVSAVEGYQVQPVSNVDRGAAVAVTTPVEPGTLDVRAAVTLELEVVQ